MDIGKTYFIFVAGGIGYGLASSPCSFLHTSLIVFVIVGPQFPCLHITALDFINFRISHTRLKHPRAQRSPLRPPSIRLDFKPRSDSLTILKSQVCFCLSPVFFLTTHPRPQSHVRGNNGATNRHEPQRQNYTSPTCIRRVRRENRDETHSTSNKISVGPIIKRK